MHNKHDWLIFLVILMLIFLAAGRTALDTDLWWHLRAGEETVASGFPLLADHFSFTCLGKPWVNHSWLSEVVFYLLFQSGSFTALSILVAGVSAASMALLFFQMSGTPILRAFLLVLGTSVAAVVWSPRPQVFSLLLLSAVQLILFLFKWKKRDLLWCLPLLFILWSNLHGGYPLGIILIIVTLFGEIVNHWLKPDLVEALTWKQLRKLAIAGILCGLAVVVNPNGFNIWLIPFQTVEMRSLQTLIQEWASPDFHEFFQQPFLWLLFAVMSSFAFAGKKVDSVDLLAVTVFGYMGLVSRRNFGPFALVAVPILSRYIWIAIQHYKDRSKESFELTDSVPTGRFIKPFQKTVNLLLVGGLFAAGLLKIYAVNHPTLVLQNLNQTMPVGAVTWMKENQPRGHMLNEYNWGGYLSWTVRESPIFIDGRTDLYGDKIIDEWLELVQAGERWAELMEQYQIDIVLLQPQQPIVRELLDRGWIQSFKDEISVILTRPTHP